MGRSNMEATHLLAFWGKTRQRCPNYGQSRALARGERYPTALIGATRLSFSEPSQSPKSSLAYSLAFLMIYHRSLLPLRDTMDDHPRGRMK